MFTLQAASSAVSAMPTMPRSALPRPHHVSQDSESRRPTGMAVEDIVYLDGPWPCPLLLFQACFRGKSPLRNFRTREIFAKRASETEAKNVRKDPVNRCNAKLSSACQNTPRSTVLNVKFRKKIGGKIARLPYRRLKRPS